MKDEFFRDFSIGKIKTRSYNNYHIIGNRTGIIVKTRPDIGDVELIAIKFPNGIIVGNRGHWGLNPTYRQDPSSLFGLNVDLTNIDVIDQEGENFVCSTSKGNFYMGRVPGDGTYGAFTGSFTTVKEALDGFEQPHVDAVFIRGIWFIPIPPEEVTSSFEPSEEELRAAIKPSSLLDGPFRLVITKSPKQQAAEKAAHEALEKLVHTYGTSVKDWYGNTMYIDGQVYNNPTNGKTYVKGYYEGENFNCWHEARVVIQNLRRLNHS